MAYFPFYIEDININWKQNYGTKHNNRKHHNAFNISRTYSKVQTEITLTIRHGQCSLILSSCCIH